VLVGQNPGKAEDATGKPFVGRAGRFLSKTLAENGMNRADIFITNIVKHATPNNRKPMPDEIETCKPYLTTQLEIIAPSTIVLMGKIAAQASRIEGIRYVETVHPSAAMRFTKMRKKFEEDFKKL
jgi:DNA polymerase